MCGLVPNDVSITWVENNVSYGSDVTFDPFAEPHQKISTITDLANESAGGGGGFHSRLLLFPCFYGFYKPHKQKQPTAPSPCRGGSISFFSLLVILLPPRPLPPSACRRRQASFGVFPPCSVAGFVSVDTAESAPHV